MNDRWLALLVLVAAGAAMSPGQKVTAQNVIDAYLRAQGGSKALAQIRTETLAGSLSEESTGMIGSYSLIAKTPNRFYSEIIVEPERFVEAYNGMSAWGQNPVDGVQTLIGAAAKEADASGRYWNSRLADVKKDKFSLQLLGVEKVRERDAYRIQVTVGPGISRDVFFDTETHLITREIAGAQQFDYDDYRPVNGIQAPYRIELRRGGRDYRISVTRVEFNSPADDSVFDFPRPVGTPVPDIGGLIREVAKNQKALEEMRKQYTCRLTIEEEETDSKGKAKTKTNKEFEVFHIGSEEVRRLVAKDGKTLGADEKKKEDERFNKQFEKLTKELAKKQAELAADPKKQEKENAQQDAEISDFLRAERFSNPRRERFRGQDVIAVDFGPNPDHKPKGIGESLAQKLVGVMWIDDQAHQIPRLEAHLSDSAKIAGGLLLSLDKGSNFVFEQAKVNDEVWLPSYAEVHMMGRLLVIKAKANEIIRYSDYKKFHVDSKIIPEQN